MIETNIERLRDPFVLVEDGVYYVYGTRPLDDGFTNTEWCCYKNLSGKLDGEWIKLEKAIDVEPPNCQTNKWAPEVYKYKGFYYMFATYFSSVTNHRGCSILKSESPEGPFVEITDGHITPPDWNCIDGTFYVDEDGQPWMVFVNEWACTEDHVGRMDIAKLSDDLTHFISDPVEIFRADDPDWAKREITDGCYMYTTKDKQLLMIWSNFDKDGYCVGIARSKNGRIDGEWIHDEKLLFARSLTGKYDGGHGMIFTDTDGQMYLSIHSPNEKIGDRREKPVFIPLHEENGTLICDIVK